MTEKCPFSFEPVDIPAGSTVVECPQCGSIRTVTAGIFPEHKELMGTTRERPRWKRVGDKWIEIKAQA